jgi:hypothetical protein
MTAKISANRPRDYPQDAAANLIFSKNKKILIFPAIQVVKDHISFKEFRNFRRKAG